MYVYVNLSFKSVRNIHIHIQKVYEIHEILGLSHLITVAKKLFYYLFADFIFSPVTYSITWSQFCGEMFCFLPYDVVCEKTVSMAKC